MYYIIALSTFATFGIAAPAPQTANNDPQVIANAIQGGIQALGQQIQTNGNCAAACAAGANATVTNQATIMAAPFDAQCTSPNTLLMQVTIEMKMAACGLPATANCVSKQAPQAGCGLALMTGTVTLLGGAAAPVVSSTFGAFTGNTFSLQTADQQGTYTGQVAVTMDGCDGNSAAVTGTAGMNFEFQPANATIAVPGVATPVNAAACTICVAFE